MLKVGSFIPSPHQCSVLLVFTVLFKSKLTLDSRSSRESKLLDMSLADFPWCTLFPRPPPPPPKKKKQCRRCSCLCTYHYVEHLFSGLFCKHVSWMLDIQLLIQQIWFVLVKECYNEELHTSDPRYSKEDSRAALLQWHLIILQI